MKIDHPLARIHSAFANDLAGGQRRAEPNRNQRQHKVRKVARTLCSDDKVGQKGNDRSLGKQDQQVKFIARKHLDITARKCCPLPQCVGGRGKSFRRGRSRKIGSQAADWFNDIAAVNLSALKFLFPILSHLFGNLLATVFEGLFLRFGSIRRKWWQGSELLIDWRFQFVVKIFEAFSFDMSECLVRRSVKHQLAPHQHYDLVKQAHVFHRVRREHDCAPAFGNLSKEPHDLFFCGWIQT